MILVSVCAVNMHSFECARRGNYFRGERIIGLKEDKNGKAAGKYEVIRERRG